MIEGAGMLAPGPGHHALACSPPTRWADSENARRRAARRDGTHARPDRLRRLHVHQRHGGCCSPAGASGIQAHARGAPTRPTSSRGAQPPRHAADPATPKAPTKDISIEVLVGRPARPTPLPWAGRWRVPTCSRPRCSATIPTGVGSYLRTAGTADADFVADNVDVAVNDVWICRGGQAAEDRSKVDLTGRTVRVRDRPRRGATRKRSVWTNDLVARRTSTRTRRTRA